MVDNHFRPHFYKWVIVKNRCYDQLRGLDGYHGFQDIDQVEDDAMNFKNGIMGLGARRLDILEIEDADFATFTQTISDLRFMITDNWNRGNKRTLIFVYYAGHGIMSNTTYAVCNEAEKRNKIRFPLE